jgi:phosphopantetheine adenylyltransferase
MAFGFRSPDHQKIVRTHLLNVTNSEYAKNRKKPQVLNTNSRRQRLYPELLSSCSHYRQLFASSHDDLVHGREAMPTRTVGFVVTPQTVSTANRMTRLHD